MRVNISDFQTMANEAAIILDTISEGCFALTPDWTFAYVNGQAARLFGLDRSQLIGNSIRDVRSGLHTDAFEAACRQAMRDGHAVEATFYDPVHGSWYEARLCPVAPGLLVYVRDVTIEVERAQALRASQRHLQLMADSIPQIVWIVEASGRGVYFNRQWVAYTGVPIDSTTPMDVASEFVHPDDRSDTMRAWNAAYDHGGNFHVEHRIRSKAGTYRWFLVMAEPYRNAAGEIERWFGTSTDIHEQKVAKIALTESELRFRALANATSDVVYHMSPDWKYMHQLDGRGFLKTTTSLDEYRIEEYVHPDDLELARTTIANAIRDKAVFELEHRVLRTDDSRGWTYSRAVPILDDDGEIREWIGMASDITERKAIEEQLTEANNRKDEFLAMLAHELRNPLAPIKAAAQLLQLRSLSAERILDTSRIIDRQVAHMTNLVDELLDMSRVSKNLIELDLVPLDIRLVVNDAVEQVTPLIQSRRHRLHIHLPAQTAFVTGDKKRLVQTMANLLGNAAKFTQEGGNIELRVEVEGEQVLIDIADNGIGMTADTLAHAFDLFSQAERSSDRSQGGLGLGLALVKSLVELHGGTVATSSSGLGKGSTFTVRLPRLAAGMPVEQQSDARALPRSPGLRILVVDDNRDAADTLAMLLETMGHDVAVDYGAQEALARAAGASFHLYLLDIGLPEMDGYELARRLRGRAENAGATLVAVTGYGQESDRARALAAGFDHHIAKPIDLDKLGLVLAQLGRQAAWDDAPSSS
jgi:PAS domain S-box-containing protein